MWETKFTNGLYPVKMENKKTGTVLSFRESSATNEDYKAWNERFRHISSDMCQRLSQIREDVPNFSRTISDGLHFTPFLTGKMHKSPPRSVSQYQMSMSEVHFDISGTFRPSFGGKAYAAHLIEPRSSFS